MIYKIIVNSSEVYCSIQKLEVKKEIFCHSKINILGLISIEKYSNDNLDNLIEKPINVYVGDFDESRLIFTGFIFNYKLIKKRDELYLKITGYGYSKLLDCKNKRIFQDANKSFKDITDIILQKYDKVSITGNIKQKENIDFLVVQNDITDWELLKRLCKKFNTVLIVKDINECSEINIGEIEKQVISVDYDRIQNRKKLIFYSRKFYKLGNEFEYAGKSYIIIKIKREFKGGDLISKYTCMDKDKIEFKDPGNDKIKGSTLKAIVKENKDEEKLSRVKLEFCDYEDVWKGEKYFNVATSYSGDNSQNGVGFYFIPEINEEVLVYFPTNNEDDCIVMGSIKNNPSQFQEDPSQKIIRNTKGREFRINNDEISISAKDNEVKILLNDENIKVLNKKTSITIKQEEAEILYEKKSFNLSPKGILLKTEGGEIEISKEGIRLKGGSCEIKLNNDLDVKATAINIKGSGKIDLQSGSNLNIKASKVNIN